ncbi:MAG: M3 family metallopeptidase [Polyangiaceae bacterium]|jgi:oligopeptidase A|nr:M3 family metallopeptidase [Polyangiaceae bacterium]
MATSPPTPADNPLLALGELSDAIRFDAIRPEHIAPAIDALLARAQVAVDAIGSAAGTPTYETTLQALEDATFALERSAQLCEHLESVATSDALRATWNETQPRIAAFWSSLPLNEGLYKVLRAFADTAEAKSLEPVRRRHLERKLDDFRKHGAELSAEGKRRLTEIDVELSKLTTKFSQNVLDATNAFELLIEDEAKIAGLPELARRAARQSAEQKGKAGYRFTLHAPSFIPAVTHLDDRSLREQLYRAYNERASTGETSNRELIRGILRLRREKARLLGYKDFADFVTSDRMAKSGARALEFIADLRARTSAAFESEKAAITQFAGAPLAAWDVAYWSEKQRKARFDFDEEALRPFFPLESVLSGAFEIFRRLYGVEFVARDLPKWDDAVRPYHLMDASGAHLATVYLDLFPRDNKIQGAWMAPLATGTPPAPHVAVVAANFTPPMGELPALLSHREVETVFHELGHLMHQCLSRVPVRSLGGTNVAWDFVELPSQIMENWTWERQSVDLFAKHHETGAPIGDELFQKVLRARTYRAASMQMQQLGFAELDLDLHCRFDPDGPEDPVARVRDVLARHVTAPLPDSYAMIASFTHLFANATGYAAGYYSYKWAEVLDADAFHRFLEEGLFSRAVGESFRDAILSRGDTVDPEELYRRFRGREPKLDALLERLGLRAA